MDRRQRMVLLGIAALIAVVAVVVAVASGGGDDGGGDESTAAQTTTVPQGQDAGAPGATEPPAEKPKPEITVAEAEVEGGQPTDGVVKVKAKKNATVELRVTADGPDSLHLHGYDIEKPIVAGKTTRLRFKAKVEGVFEAELENTGTKLFDITIGP